jgi:hypothetical protein
MVLESCFPVAIPASSTAAAITINFHAEDGPNGSDLEAVTMDPLVATGTTSQSDSGITLTLTATAFIDGVISPGSILNSNASDFGINAPGGKDIPAQLDGDGGIESILFSVTSDTPLSSLVLTIADFAGVGGGSEDTGSLSFDGANSFTFNDIGGDLNELGSGDALDVNESITQGQEFTLAHVSGGGRELQALSHAPEFLWNRV